MVLHDGQAVTTELAEKTVHPVVYFYCSTVQVKLPTITIMPGEMTKTYKSVDVPMRFDGLEKGGLEFVENQVSNDKCCQEAYEL